MRAMVVPAFGTRPELREIPDPIVADGDVLLRVMACGVCHTDLKVRDGLVPDTTAPVGLNRMTSVTEVVLAITSHAKMPNAAHAVAAGARLVTCRVTSCADNHNKGR